MFHNSGFDYADIAMFAGGQALSLETAVVLEEEVRRARPDAREPYEALAARPDAPEIIRNAILAKACHLDTPSSHRPSCGAVQCVDCACPRCCLDR